MLGYMTLFMVAVLVFLAYGDSTALPRPTLTVWGQEWPDYVFAVAALMVVISWGLGVACLRRDRRLGVAVAPDQLELVPIGVPPPRPHPAAWNPTHADVLPATTRALALPATKNKIIIKKKGHCPSPSKDSWTRSWRPRSSATARSGCRSPWRW